MGLFDRVERKLESAVNGVFARAFRAEVQPVEIASAMRRAMDDRAAVVGKGRTIVPNLFVIDLAPGDFDRLTSYSDLLADELVASVQEHAEQQHYVPGGPFHVDFRSRTDLETGVFRVRPATAKRLPEPTPEYRSTEEERRHDRDAELRRAHPFRSTEAEAPAQGVTGMASHAASAAAGSLASTAAAAREAGLGPYGAPPPPVPPDPAAPGSAPGPSYADPAPAYHEPAPAYAPPPPAYAEPPASRPAAPPPVDPTERPWLEYDGDHYPLLGALTVLGRDDTADITLEDAGISRRHAEIRVTHDGPHFAVTVRDLGSTNGTFVNGDRVSSRAVADGDRVTIGRTTLVIRIGRR